MLIDHSLYQNQRWHIITSPLISMIDIDVTEGEIYDVRQPHGAKPEPPATVKPKTVPENWDGKLGKHLTEYQLTWLHNITSVSS